MFLSEKVLKIMIFKITAVDGKEALKRL